MNTVETIFLDESGTPAAEADKGLFVVGGFSVRGSTKEIAAVWGSLLAGKRILGKKGTRYSPTEYLAVSEFMCRNGIIPIASHSRLDTDDLAHLDAKMREYHQIAEKLESRANIGKRNAYVWMLQVAITTASSALSLLIHRGEITKLRISMDQYLSNEKVREIVAQVIRHFYEADELPRFLRQMPQRLADHPDTKRMLENFKPEPEFIALDWNAKGKLAWLADVVCAMYRKALMDDDGAKKAWDVLKICFTKRGKTPMCIGNDMTKNMRDAVRAPWHIPKA